MWSLCINNSWNVVTVRLMLRRYAFTCICVAYLTGIDQTVVYVCVRKWGAKLLKQFESFIKVPWRYLCVCTCVVGDDQSESSAELVLVSEQRDSVCLCERRSSRDLGPQPKHVSQPSYFNSSFVFTPRAYARAVLGVVIRSVCLSVRLSHAWIVTKLNDALRIFWYHTKGQSLCYSDTNSNSSWWATLPSVRNLRSVTHPLRETPTSTDFRL